MPNGGKKFSFGLANAVTSAINTSAGAQTSISSIAQQSREWFILSFPLLGALATSFRIIEDPGLCNRMSIHVAAVDAQMREIYINPRAGLTNEECKFVIAHELLHVGLRHDTRQLGRDLFLWNIACDYVINGWLIEMGVGEMPALGGLYDPELKGLSAESIYDIITSDMRKMRKLATLAGIGQCDILPPKAKEVYENTKYTDLDSFYHNCLMQGLDHHYATNRGVLPAGLIEAIRALAHPPIRWDIELAKWFDHYFPPVDRIRSYIRASRRQSSSPDIPKPRFITNLESEECRTFGVILDTSGSMDRSLLAKALGAIASYSLSREVSRVRLVFCDAISYDQGYVAPEELLHTTVKVKGRGGTVLQSGIKLLQEASDFPKKGPILIITDGNCERLTIHRAHAFLIPAYARLPFAAKGKLFRIQ